MIKKSILLSAILAAHLVASEDLGIINVQSSTIDDRFSAKKGEVSTTHNISGQKVDESHAENIQRVLQAIPGITTEISTGDSLKIHIRGVENQVFMAEKPGVAVVIDGVPVYERTGSVNIDLDNIANIKVIKGGASYLFGDDALSGAVIITTKKGTKNAGIKVEAEAGSYGYQKYLARYGTAEEKYNFYIQASERSKDGYHEDSDYKASYLNGKYQYYIDNSSDITAGFEYSKRDKNSHGSVTGVTEATNNPESIWTVGNDKVRDYASMFDVQLLKLFTTYAKDFDNGNNLLVNLYQYNDNTQYYSGYADYDINHVAVTDPAFKPNLNDYKQVQQGIKSEYRSPSAKTAYLVGLDLRANNYKNNVSYGNSYAVKKTYPTVSWIDYTKGTVTADDVTDENVYALYGEYKYQLSSSWSTTANLRLDTIALDYTDNLTSTNVNKTFNQYSYRLGFNNQISQDMAFYTSYSTGFRAPSIQQLFYGDINPSGTVDSNPDLHPEVSQNIDIGINGKTSLMGSAATYEVTLFNIQRDDYIMSSSGQYASIIKNAANSQYQNIGGMRSRGLELAFNTDSSKSLAFNVSYTYMDAKFTKYDNFNLLLGNPYGNYVTEQYNLTGNKIPRVSDHHLNLSVDYKPTDKLVLTPELDAVSSYYADELNRIKIGGFAVWNFLASYNTKVSEYDIKFFARVDNVFDRTYYNSARGYRDSDSDGDYDQEDISISVNEGRIYTAGLSAKF